MPAQELGQPRGRAGTLVLLPPGHCPSSAPLPAPASRAPPALGAKAPHCFPARGSRRSVPRGREQPRLSPGSFPSSGVVLVGTARPAASLTLRACCGSEQLPWCRRSGWCRQAGGTAQPLPPTWGGLHAAGGAPTAREGQPGCLEVPQCCLSAVCCSPGPARQQPGLRLGGAAASWLPWCRGGVRTPALRPAARGWGLSAAGVPVPPQVACEAC